MSEDLFALTILQTGLAIPEINMENHEYTDFTINQLIETWKELADCLAKHPEKLANGQVEYWQAYLKMAQEYDANPESLPTHETTDKRFQYKDWYENLSYHFIKRSYLLLSQQLKDFVFKLSEHEDIATARKLRFFTRQLIDALSPTNFISTNPEILSQTLEENGVNLLKGMKNFLHDLEQGKGLLTINNTDLASFNLGENIACTPGKVIFQNDLMQLIQYQPTTKQVYQYPLLIIPPWINKYYIFDLQQENSFVKWLVDKGFSVFMISWVNPTRQHKDKQFADYMLDGPLTALTAIKKVTKETKTNVLGYCIGGTLLGCMLAYLAKKKKASIPSATFLATLFDFSEPGELGTFTDEQQISLLESHMESKGYLHGSIMASVFNALRANDLIWSAFINQYLKGQAPKPFDLLYWNADPTNIPKDVHSFYLRNMYLNNYLVQSNKIKLNKTSIDLMQIKVPSYFLAAQDDHIVPWQSCLKSCDYYGGSVKFVLTTSGHVAGVVNPPHKNKYGYWTNAKTPKSPETYLSTGTFHSGSWWNDWVEWLKHYSGELVAVDYYHINKKNMIEPAPGSYVKIKLDQILEG